MTAPRVTRLSGEARKAITSATALGATQLVKSEAGIAARLAGVSSTEGATALTQISSPEVSWASAWVIAATAALAVAYATIPEPSRGSSPGRAATLTMRPPLAPPGPGSARERIARIAAAEHRNEDSAFIWNWSAKSTAEVSATGDIAK